MSDIQSSPNSLQHGNSNQLSMHISNYQQQHFSPMGQIGNHPPMRPKLSDDLFQEELLEQSAGKGPYLDRLKSMLQTGKHVASGQPVSRHKNNTGKNLMKQQFTTARDFSQDSHSLSPAGNTVTHDSLFPSVATPKPQEMFLPYKTSMKQQLMNSGHATNVYYQQPRLISATNEGFVNKNGQKLSPIGLRKQSVYLDNLVPKGQQNSQGVPQIEATYFGQKSFSLAPKTTVNVNHNKEAGRFHHPGSAAQKMNSKRIVRNLSQAPQGKAVLLSQYRPKEFGNAQIDLTVDGGQHLRSPGDSPPKITRKAVESIFKDPVFDHKQQLEELEAKNRKLVVKKIQNKFDNMGMKLERPENYRAFFFSEDCRLFGFGTQDQISAAKDTLHYYNSLMTSKKLNNPK